MADRFNVSKTATCDRCGNNRVYWQRSRKGTFYLVDVRADNTTSTRDFHSNTCNAVDPGNQAEADLAEAERSESPARMDSTSHGEQAAALRYLASLAKHGMSIGIGWDARLKMFVVITDNMQYVCEDLEAAIMEVKAPAPATAAIIPAAESATLDQSAIKALSAAFNAPAAVKDPEVRAMNAMETNPPAESAYRVSLAGVQAPSANPYPQQAEYQCLLNTAHQSVMPLQKGKPVKCAHCKGMMRFIKAV